MKALFIGGTGTISMAIIRKLAEDPQWEVWLLNRGNRKAEMPEGIHQIIADIHDEAAAAKVLEGSIRTMRHAISACSAEKQNSISSSARPRRTINRLPAI